MAREPINWKVEEIDVKEFIKPINIEIPINKWQYSYILDNKTNDDTLKLNLKQLENYMIGKIYKEDTKYKKIVGKYFSLSYIPDFKNNNWKLGYSPIKIINGIFEVLNINEKLEYIDYSDKKILDRAKNRVMLILIEEQLTTLRETATTSKEKHDKLIRLEFIENTMKNVDNIFNLYDYEIENKIKNQLVYKNLLYYLSVKSLDILDETDDINYAYIPKTYYDEVTSKKKAEYPRQLYMDDGSIYSYNYETFNKRFNKVLFRYPSLFEKELGLEEINVLDNFMVLKSDDFIEDVANEYNCYLKRKDYTKTDNELNEMLINKINFYKELLSLTNEKGEKIVVSTVKGIHQLNDYYGFVLNNNYIVLDKFFTITKKDNEIKPSSDEALFSMPLDLYIELEGSKRKIKEYVKKHPNSNVKRMYHMKKHSYRDKILKVTEKEDISTVKNDWFVSIYAPKKLTLAK